MTAEVLEIGSGVAFMQGAFTMNMDFFGWKKLGESFFICKVARVPSW